MKRRLTRAYDHMTMPDRCSNAIERKLVEELEYRKTGRSVRTVAPSPARRQGWTLGVAAVCLMLVLSMGGTALFLKTMGTVPDVSRQTTAATRTAAPGDYTLVTDIPAEEVEAFASAVRQNVIDGDWEAFAECVNYPIAVYDKQIGNDGGLVGLTIRNRVNDSFVEQIEKEDCSQLFCNWQGICMADGRLWINEVDGQLKITAINDMFGALVNPADFQYVETENGDLALAAYSGMAEEVTFPTGYNQSVLTQIGTGKKVIWNGSLVRTIHIPDTVTAVREQAFADCPGLEAVFFQGDAPAEMEDVFDGSPNVVVYYKEGTEGWGDTWCGRKTMQYGEGHISLGTATMKINPATAYQALMDVLHENRSFYYEGSESAVTITQYCERRSKHLSNEVSIPCFTMADMDRDGINELILWVSIEGDALEDYLILRYDPYDHDEGGMVYAFMEPQQKITDIGKDGSFFWRAAGPGQGESRMILDPDNGNGIVVSSLGEENDAEAVWHVWPCVRPEVVAQSYEYAGTAKTRLPGNGYYTFEGLAKGTTDNDWNRLKEDLTAMGMICLEDEGTVSVFDPDAPGTCLYGTLTNANGMLQLADVGYYICTEEKEYAAEIRNLLSADPEYWVDAHLPALGSMGRRVYNTQKLLEYLNGKELNDVQADEVSQEHEQIRTLMNHFLESCIAADTEGIRACLADGVSVSEIDPIDVELAVISYSNFPSQVIEPGGAWSIDLSLREEENPEANWYLTAMLVKQEEGWRIFSCHLF